MGLFRWMRGWFGSKKEAAPASPTPPPVVAATPSVRPPAKASVPPPADDPVRRSWINLKDFVARCDREELDLAGLHIQDPIEFWARHARIEVAKLRGASADKAIAAEGFSCAEHWVVVQRYFQSRYSELVRLENGSLAVRYVDSFQRLAHRAEREIEGERQRIELATAELEPIAGVTLEQFAEIGAALSHMGAQATRARTTELLAAYGLGAATFGSVRRGWEARMEADRTRRLRRTFRQAWTGAREKLESGKYRLPGSGQTEVSTVSTRYTWVESVEARPEYRSSLMTG